MFADTWFLILTLCGLAWMTWAFVSSRKQRAHPPLPPGPSGLPILGSLPFLDPELHSYFRDLARTYGPIFSLRLGSKMGVVVTSPSGAKEILKDFDVTFANHEAPIAGKVLTYGGSDILWTPYGPQWRMLRKDVVIAGTDTTSSTVEFAMAEIVNKPEVLRRCQQELENMAKSRDGGLLDESHILQLPYLQAIVKETLRLHPVVPLLVPHCPTESCTVGGYTIPKGSRVFINAWAIQRDPSLWEDPLEFKPERFLDGKYDLNGSDFSYLPFGSGRRICVGMGMAERMVMFSLASILHYFDWKLPQGVEKVNLQEKFGITLMKRTPLLLIPSPRSSNLAELSSF